MAANNMDADSSCEDIIMRKNVSFNMDGVENAIDQTVDDNTRRWRSLSDVEKRHFRCKTTFETLFDKIEVGNFTPG